MKEKQAEKIVTLYMVALGGTKLPEKVWKKIAKVNQLILDKYGKGIPNRKDL